MADDVQPIDPTLCTNLDSPGESCGGTFDHKSSPGLCAACYMAVKDTERAELMKDWPQCTGCSAQLKLLKGPRCGTCLKKDQQIVPPLGTQDQNRQPDIDAATKTLQDLQAEARRNAMQARTLQKGGSKAPVGSASLQVAIAKGVSRQITVYLVPMTSSSTRTEASRILANASRSFPEDLPMSDALTHLLRHWNLDWEKECSESLTPEHISLRLLGNLGIQPHSTIGTLGQFFDTHDRIHGNHPKKILQGPATLRLPPPAIYLEGFISVNDTRRTENGKLARQLRSLSRLNLARQSALGRLSAPLPLRSEFGDVPGFSKVSFVFASVSIAQDGAVTIAWPALGRDETAPSVIFDGLPWVAKRFFNIGSGEGDVDIQENHNQVVKEATRLSKTAYFLKRFIAEAKRQGVDIEEGIEVTDFKLGIEVIEDGSGPSEASGFSPEQYQTALEAQHDPASDPTSHNANPGLVIWLFEPRRSSKAKHWSGTNEYPPWHQNKLGSTLNAFTHYAYIFSLESTALCDLQTSTVINDKGDGIQVLFDVMTHTLDGSSGVGDHGETGIQTFLEKHECVNRCNHLRLSRDGFESNSEPAHEESD
ncbi:kinase-like domain-containing protein, partial [Mycena galericulata]